MIGVDLLAVTASYDHRFVLHDVSLSIERGEWLGLIGPNGAGKTTLLRAIAGLIDCAGDIVLDGRSAPELRPRERARIVAIVHQRPVLPPAMSVADYVLLGRTPHIAYFDTETKHDLDIVSQCLDRLGILDFAERPLGQLSGGEQQRVVLARALAQQAPVLLLDEGTSALDVGGQQEVLELVESLRTSESLTVLSAMHDLTLAGQFADTLALLSEGRLVALGSAEAVLREDLIRAHYNATVRITHGPEGIVVSPMRRHAPQRVEASR